MQWHQLDHMQTICTSLQTDNNTNTLSVNFYRLDALPDHQPTVSIHWRQMTIIAQTLALKPKRLDAELLKPRQKIRISQSVLWSHTAKSLASWPSGYKAQTPLMFQSDVSDCYYQPILHLMLLSQHMQSRIYVTVRCPSICLSVRSIDSSSGWFNAEHR